MKIASFIKDGKDQQIPKYEKNSYLQKNGIIWGYNHV